MTVGHMPADNRYVVDRHVRLEKLTRQHAVEIMEEGSDAFGEVVCFESVNSAAATFFWMMWPKWRSLWEVVIRVVIAPLTGKDGGDFKRSSVH